MKLFIDILLSQQQPQMYPPVAKGAAFKTT